MRAPSDRGRLGLLVACLAMLAAGIVGLAILLGSVPAGRDGVVGFSLASAGMFRNFTGLPTPALTPGGFSRAMVAVLAGSWLAWLAAVLVHRGMSAAGRTRARALVIGGGALLLGLGVVLVPPVLSADLYRQAIYGRMLLRYDLNPYASPASDAIGDELLAFANHTQVTTTYGPVYTWLSAGAVGVAPWTPLGTALAWKTMSALAALACLLLAAPVARALSARGAREPSHEDHGLHAQLLLAWNPLCVVEAAGAAHIEPIMMAFALAGLLLALRGRRVGGVLMLLASTFTKWVTGVLLVLVAAREVAEAPAGARVRTVLRVAGPALLMTALLYLPFAAGLRSRGGVHDLAMRGAVPLGDASRAFPPQWAMMASFAVLVLGAIRYTATRDWPRLVATAAILLVVLSVVVLPWLFPWYLVAPMTLAAVLPRDRAGSLVRLICFGLGASLMFYYAKLVPLR